MIRHPSLGIGREIPTDSAFGEMEEEQEIIDADDRVLVPDTKKAPFRWICSLELYFEDPDNRGQAILLPATGTLISERHVLTAGHVLVNDIVGTKGTKKKLKPRRITVIPGRWTLGRTEAEQMPFGSSESASLHIARNWERMLDPFYDYGLIRLKKPLGRAPLGFWGGKVNGKAARLAPVQGAGLRGKTVYSAGYPSDKCGHLPPKGSAPDPTVNPCLNRGTGMWSTTGIAISTPGTNRLNHSLDTQPGQSGSPVWLENAGAGTLDLIAIHTGPSGSGKSNAALLLTEEVLREVKRWM